MSLTLIDQFAEGREPNVKILRGNRWRPSYKVLEPGVVFLSGRYNVGIKVPSTFETDLTSLPRILPMFFDTPAVKAPAIVHDYLYHGYGYNRARLSRKQCDLIFYDAMLANDVCKIQAKVWYGMVRSFGWLSYKKVS